MPGNGFHHHRFGFGVDALDIGFIRRSVVFLLPLGDHRRQAANVADMIFFGNAHKLPHLSKRNGHAEFCENVHKYRCRPDAAVIHGCAGPVENDRFDRPGIGLLANIDRH
jgi:hypothetical protein